MPPKRARKRVGNRARGSGDSGLGMVDPQQEQKNENIRLFMLDFIQQKKDRMAEVKKDLEVLISLPEQLLEVELLKMPMSVRQMKVGDYYRMMEENNMETAALVKKDELDKELREAKLVRKNSKKVKVTRTTESTEPAASKVTSTLQKSRTAQKVPKSKSLVSLNSDSAKKPTLTRSVSATPINKAPKRTLALTARATSQTTLRSTRSRQASLLSDNQQLSERVASFQIPLAGGQTLSSSLSHLESIDEKLLTEDAVKHIQALVGKLTSLCSKVSPQQPDNRR